MRDVEDMNNFAANFGNSEKVTFTFGYITEATSRINMDDHSLKEHVIYRFFFKDESLDILQNYI